MRAERQCPAERVDINDLFAGRACESAACDKGLFWEEEAADYVFQLAEGLARMVKISPDGRRAVFGFAFPGDVVGLSAADRYPFNLEAVTAVRFRRASRQLLYQWVIDAPSAALALADLLREEVRMAQSHAHLLLSAGADSRLANFLVGVASRTPGALEGTSEFVLAMSRMDIADHLGLTMETVCRTMTKFRVKEIIRTRGPHQIRVHDPARLLVEAGRASDESPAAARAPCSILVLGAADAGRRAVAANRMSRTTAA